MLIIGAGEAGVRAAFALREQGFSGEIDLYGAERHLPYERPPLSKYLNAGEPPPAKSIRTLEAFSDNRIGLHLGCSVIGIDPKQHFVRLADGSHIDYGRLLLATGASPRRLSIPGSEHCMYLRTIDDAEALAGHFRPGAAVAVIGAGFIGLEVAASARQAGCNVTVLEGFSRVLARAVPEEIAVSIHRRHTAADIDIICNVSLASIELMGQRKKLILADGREVLTDVILAGIGAAPLTELATSAGLAVDNGILVDEMLRTSDPDIFAAGDCCSFPHLGFDGLRLRLESWRAAQEHGEIAAANMLRQGQTYQGIPWFWSDQFEMTLQIAGLPHLAWHTVARPGADGQFLFHLDAENRLVAVSSWGQGNAMAKDIRLAERLTANRICIDPEHLLRADLNLKSLLAS